MLSFNDILNLVQSGEYDKAEQFAAQAQPSVRKALGDEFLRRGMPDRAAKLYKSVSEVDGEACYKLSQLYAVGSGVPKDEKLRMLWLIKANELGYSPTAETKNAGGTAAAPVRPAPPNAANMRPTAPPQQNIRPPQPAAPNAAHLNNAAQMPQRPNTPNNPAAPVNYGDGNAPNAPAKLGGKGKKIAASIISIVLVLCLGGGFAFAYTKGYISFGKSEKSDETTQQEETPEPTKGEKESTAEEQQSETVTEDMSATTPSTELAPVFSPIPKKDNESLNLNLYVLPPTGLHLRTLPSTEAESKTLMSHAKQVTVLFFRGDWAYVKYDSLYGWCHRDYLDENTKISRPPNVDKKDAASVSAPRPINVYDSKELTNPIFSLRSSEQVVVLYYEGDLVYIRCAEKHGWCKKSDLSITVGAATEKTTVGLVTSYTVLLLRSPDHNAPSVGTLNRNTITVVVGRTGDWVEVFVDGIRGWCSLDEIRVDYIENIDLKSLNLNEEPIV